MSQTKQEGFSYESPGKQRKSALKLLTVEIIVLALLVVLILGALNYLGVNPIGNIVSQLLPTQNQQSSEEVIIVPAQDGYGPGDDSSGWVPPEWMKQ